MMIQHVMPISVEGATLFDLSLSVLHSTTIECDELKQWVNVLADSISYVDDEPEEDSSNTFHEQFMFELLIFCLYVAACDGPISDKILENINYLIDEFDVDRETAIRTLQKLSDAGWMKDYPRTFKMLVWYASDGDDGILVASEIFYFYHQAARFIYSIENDGDFDEKSEARGYVDAFRKYVERVSVIDFDLPPENERSIKAVCREWKRLVEAERIELRRNACGTWRGVSGDALTDDVLSDLFLAGNGEGALLGSSSTGKKSRGVHWTVMELPGMNMLAPVVHISEMKASAVMMLLDHDRMLATVYSNDRNLNLKTALYQRENSDTKSAPAPVKQTHDVVGQNSVQVSAALGKETPKPKRTRLKAIAIGAIAVVVLAGMVIGAIEQSKPETIYGRATSSYEAGKYKEAAGAFESLGDYGDSDAMRRKALLGVEAQAAEQKAGEDPTSWTAAAEAYERLEDSSGWSRAGACRNKASYYTGKQLKAEGRWVEARDAFASISEKSFKDVSNLLDECNAHVLYDEAERLFAEGSYYDAYVRFKEISDRKISYLGLSDASTRARACVQDIPETGEIYGNPDYSSSDVQLTINNSHSNAYIKIYSGDDLVRSLFIRSNDSVSVSLPVGTYRMNEAHGNHWFDPQGAFGDDGQYFKCTFAGEDVFTLEWGYDYEITTSYGYKVGGTGMGSQKIDQEAF